jgi:hypothetical protein
MQVVWRESGPWGSRNSPGWALYQQHYNTQVPMITTYTLHIPLLGCPRRACSGFLLCAHPGCFKEDPSSGIACLCSHHCPSSLDTFTPQEPAPYAASTADEETADAILAREVDMSMYYRPPRPSRAFFLLSFLARLQYTLGMPQAGHGTTSRGAGGAGGWAHRLPANQHSSTHNPLIKPRTDHPIWLAAEGSHISACPATCIHWSQVQRGVVGQRLQVLAGQDAGVLQGLSL